MTKPAFVLAGMLLQSMLLLAAAPPPASSGREVPPLPLAEIRAITGSPTLSDAEKIARLLPHLDRRLTMAAATDDDDKLREIGRDIATLIGSLAQPVPYTERQQRREALEQMLERMPAGLEHQQQVRRYLYLALGIAGGEVPEELFLSLLREPDTSESILTMTLRSMSHSNVPIRALPRLLELADHPSNYTYQTGVGPPESKRVYPIRDAVFDCLQKLGIDSRKTKRPPETPEEKEHPGLAETIVTVDRQALLGKLKTWIESDDPKLWRPAIDALRGLDGEDAAALLRELQRRETLADEKRSALQGKP